jgi:molecular chaperone HscB
MPAEFLMQQMAWREALDDAAKLEDLEQLSLQCAQAVREQLQKCEHFLDVQHDYASAVGSVGAT